MQDPQQAPAPPADGRQPLTGLVIRACRPQDSEAIADLINLPGFRFGTLRLPFHTPEEVRRWMDQAQPGNIELVAVVDGQIVGSGGLQRFSGRRAHVGRIGMGVHDAWRNRGIGTALLAALIEAADRWLGLRRLELNVYIDNEQAIRLYRRFGFDMEGTHRAFALRDGVLVDAFAMARVVEAGSR
jgi:L-phenylalanine/L-methionine N-acetyltransferase